MQVLTLVTDITWFWDENLARQSRGHYQNNCHKSHKHVLYRLLEENFSKP